MKNIRIVNIDIYCKEGYSIFDNCIYVGIDFSKVRYINNRLFGIILSRDYNEK